MTSAPRYIKIPRFTFIIARESSYASLLAKALISHNPEASVVAFNEPLREAISVMCAENWSITEKLEDAEFLKLKPFTDSDLTYWDLNHFVREAIEDHDGLFFARTAIARHIDTEFDSVVFWDTPGVHFVNYITEQVPPRECLTILGGDKLEPKGPGKCPFIALASSDLSDNLAQLNRELGLEPPLHT